MIRVETDHIWSDVNPDLLIRHTERGWELPWTDGHCVSSSGRAQWAAEVAERKPESTTDVGARIVPLRDAAKYLGLPVWQMLRALSHNLFPDDTGAIVDEDGEQFDSLVPWPWVDEVAQNLTTLLANVGTIPNLGASRAAGELSQRLGITVTREGVLELARTGHLSEAGTYEGHQLYSGLDIEAFTDTARAAKACLEGRLIDPREAAEYLGIRESDFKHILRAGLITATTREHGWADLYRAGDLDALEATHSHIDWDAVRATPKGRKSLLADLPDTNSDALTSNHNGDNR